MWQLISDAWDYIVAVIAFWQSYATGGVVMAALSAWEKLTNRAVSRRVYIRLVLISFFIVAGFMAWREERVKAQAAFNPKFKITAGRVGILPWPLNASQCLVYAEATITNTGTRSVLSFWGLDVALPERSRLLGRVTLVRGENLRAQNLRGESEVFPPSESKFLPEVTTAAINTGIKHRDGSPL